jgi:hypothetical protein
LTINILIYDNDHTNDLIIANGKLKSNDFRFTERCFSIIRKYIENEKNYLQEESLVLDKDNFDDVVEKQKNNWLNAQDPK